MTISKHRIALWTGLPALLNIYHRHRLLVVTYHGVYGGPDDAGHVYPDTFVHVDQMEAQLTYLRRRYRVISPEELLQSIKSRTPLPVHAALVTFDDAYVNFKRLAFPVLKRLGITPIVFVPTYYVENQVPLWYDLVWYYCGRSPRPDLEPIGRKLRIQLQDLQPEQMSAACLGVLKRFDFAARSEIIQDISNAMNRDGMSPAEELADFLVLQADELRELSKEGVCFGGHTHTHTILTSMEHAAAHEEIRLNKSRLETILGQTVHFFAYPNGSENDFTRQHEKMLQQTGYAGAFTLNQTRSSHPENPMAISRIHVAPEDTMDSFRMHCTGIVPIINKARYHLSCS
ncbi:MAG: polysaccharide deacetylase family protein [Thermodesulfobacteriota bacterium]